MLPYLTPERYRSMGFGSTDQTDEHLLSLINRASLAVDRYCSVPMVPDRYSFRGGTVTDEEHPFHLGDGVVTGPTKTIWPRSYPVKSVSDMKVYVTNTQYVDFSTGGLFVTKRNISITSLTITSVGLFGAFTVPVIGLATPICKVTYDYGWDFSSVDEVLMHTEGKLYRAQNQFWNADAVVVKVDGVVQSSGITLDRVEGTVTFDASLDPDAVVTASYGYALPNEVSQATGLTVADFIGKKELQERGMSGVQSISVGEISIDRPRPRAATSNVSMDVPNEAQQLLQGLNFITIR